MVQCHNDSLVRWSLIIKSAGHPVINERLNYRALQRTIGKQHTSMAMPSVFSRIRSIALRTCALTCNSTIDLPSLAHALTSRSPYRIAHLHVGF